MIRAPAAPAATGAPGAGFRISSSARIVRVDGLYVLLDLLANEYEIFNEISGRFWDIACAERPPAPALKALAGEYAADRECVIADYRAFVLRAVENRWLCDDETAAASSEPEDLRFAPALLWQPEMAAARWIRRVNRSLARQHFHSLYTAIAQRRYTVRDGGGPNRERLVDRYLRIENLISSSRAPEDCLPRSLSLYGFLASYGCNVEHVIGVRRTPFTAHAWVAGDNGEPLLETTWHLEDFVPIAQIRNHMSRD